MKKIKVFSIVIALGAIALVSCKKDRVCECKIYVNGSSFGDPQKTTLNDVSKRTAKDACITRKATENGIEMKIECELK